MNLLQTIEQILGRRAVDAEAELDRAVATTTTALVNAGVGPGSNEFEPPNVLQHKLTVAVNESQPVIEARRHLNRCSDVASGCSEQCADAPEYVATARKNLHDFTARLVMLQS